jgi:signal transduction histidine kinase
VDESLFRAAQEGLTNVRKHADATRTAVVLDFQDDDHVRLEVRDDGRGLAGQQADGFGLAGLRERMASIGGHLTLRSGVADGVTTLVVEVPG